MYDYPVSLDRCSTHFNCLHAGQFFMLFSSSADLFFFKIIRNTIRVSNSLDPDQDRGSVGFDLGPNCLQSLSAEDK